MLAEAAWVASAQGAPSASANTAVAGVLIHLFAASLLSVGLVRLPRPPENSRTRAHTLLESAVAALALSILAYQLVLPQAVTSDDWLLGMIAALDPAGSVVLGTLVVLVLARARNPGGMPFRYLGPLALGIAMQVIADSLTAASQTSFLVVGPILAKVTSVVASGLVAFAACRDLLPMRADAHLLRERTAVIAPVVPLAVVGAMILEFQVTRRPLNAVTAALGMVMLVVLLLAAVLSRLEALEVSRTLETRVVERTLDLGTREKWFRSLVQFSSDVVAVL